MNRYVGQKVCCGSEIVHYPHVLSHYTTVRYGELERFCPGVAEKRNKDGEITKKSYFKIIEEITGDALTASVLVWELI